ncbi:hypothetical protein P152DRAFT_462867 [Eremomyces bilateralis CBS 781.70]|uniref:Something about silencing protein 4 domain-containing protein n=1 Tax=Eremomyces bilateralis CBS 781.70 TaxID=1392243 RepID=A0A6G1FQT8_9PEZI|nr:uncharacterized protein P152DRAFT_462867 [Eremomyces bilateralis CBS 781.70]KAF1808133.1 hypothetical protein P152DRAFT_462867 [Eremomyces bilateralis CBS 781.70]
MKFMPLMPLRRSQGRVLPSPPPPHMQSDPILHPITKPKTRSAKVADSHPPLPPTATNRPPNPARVGTQPRIGSNGFNSNDDAASPANGNGAASGAKNSVTVLRNGTRVLHATGTHPSPPKGVKRPHDDATDAKAVKYPKKTQTKLKFAPLPPIGARDGRDGAGGFSGHELQQETRQDGKEGKKRVRTRSGQATAATEVTGRKSALERMLVPPKPAAVDAVQTADKRTLRSQDGGTRMKSDLAIYFSNYDDIITGAPKARDVIEIDSKIFIMDEPVPDATRPSTSPAASKTQSTSPYAKSHRRSAVSSKPESSTSNGIHPVHFPSISPSLTTPTDPLPDTHYFKPHRRAERKEKQLRNIEKERAQHEKVQLERLLDGLLSPDWLKVMGISGVTESEKKEYEERRAYFVREVRALVEKFRVWKEEERRLKMEREQAVLAREAAATEEEQQGGDESEDGEDVEEEEQELSLDPPRHKPLPHDSDSTSTTDIGAHATQQLLAEASASRPSPPTTLPTPPSPPKPFTSFFAKPHLRAQAMGQQRHGRKAYAFGREVAEGGEREFELPEELRTEEAVRRNARRRRRVRRRTGGEEEEEEG